MNKVSVTLIILFSLSGLPGCSHKPTENDLLEIRTLSWTFVSGDKIGDGDFIDFETDGYYELKNDSVFKQRKFTGKIVGYNARNREIRIRRYDGKPAIYYNHNYQ